MSFLPPLTRLSPAVSSYQLPSFVSPLKAHETKTQILGSRLLEKGRQLSNEKADLHRFPLWAQKLASLHSQATGTPSRLRDLLFHFCNPPTLQACTSLLNHQAQLKAHLKRQNELLLAETEAFLKIWVEYALAEDETYFPTAQQASFYLMQAVCGGERLWQNLPILDLSQTHYVQACVKKGLDPLEASSGENGRIDYIKAEEMDQSLMRGQDGYGRHFLAIKDQKQVQVFFEADNEQNDFCALYQGCWLISGDSLVPLGRDPTLITGRANADILSLRSLAVKIKELREKDIGL
jgi:hypothetical protein